MAQSSATLARHPRVELGVVAYPSMPIICPSDGHIIENPRGVLSHTELYRCAIDRQMTKGQVRAIVDKYVENHPGDLSYCAAQLVFLAMNEVCAPR